MKFRNIIRVALAVALIAGIAGNADAAKKRTKGKAKARTTAAAPAVTKGETKSYGDNLSTQMFKIKKGESVIEVEYPVAGDLLPGISTMRSYLVDALAREAQISPYEFDDVFFVKSNELGFPGGTNPYITSDGLTYRYSAYEIGPYAMGMPEAVIPFSAARSLVAGKAAEFLK